MLAINSTDIGIGGVFTFLQPTFDWICSDLSKMKVAQAVTASSAVPGLFEPLLLQNFAGTCGFPEPPWIEEALANPLLSRRRYHDARAASTYFDREQRPYVFLVDGGVADNLGVHRILSEVIEAGGATQLARDSGVELPEHIVYIIVNAQAEADHHWDSVRSVPSLTTILRLVSSTGIDRYNFETIELLRDSVVQWEAQLAKAGQTLHPYVVEIAFDNLADAEEREYFNGIKTSFDLDDTTVDRLIDVGGRLLRESPDFKQFMAAME
jgi:NTE family protein